jgi:hypothetical protein
MFGGGRATQEQVPQRPEFARYKHPGRNVSRSNLSSCSAIPRWEGSQCRFQLIVDRQRLFIIERRFLGGLTRQRIAVDIDGECNKSRHDTSARDGTKIPICP